MVPAPPAGAPHFPMEQAWQYAVAGNVIQKYHFVQRDFSAKMMGSMMSGFVTNHDPILHKMEVKYRIPKKFTQF